MVFIKSLILGFLILNNNKKKLIKLGQYFGWPPKFYSPKNKFWIPKMMFLVSV